MFEAPVYETRMIETPNNTKTLIYSIEAYGDFGWQLKEKELIDSDNVRLTFQRNKNAVWRTPKLLGLEKRFDECEKNIQDGYDAILATNELKLKKINDDSFGWFVGGFFSALMTIALLGAAILINGLIVRILFGAFSAVALVFAILLLFVYSKSHKEWLKKEETRVNSMHSDSQIQKLKNSINNLKEERKELRKEATSIIEND